MDILEADLTDITTLLQKKRKRKNKKRSQQLLWEENLNLNIVVF